MSDFDLLLRLRAVRDGRAVFRSGRLQVAVQPHARILTLISMAGEDTTIHTALEGAVGSPPDTRCIPDPRNRDDQAEIYRWIGSRLDLYFRDCRRKGTYPQVWVSSLASTGHLDVLAERLRYYRKDQRIRCLGELLSYLTLRHPIAGQQALCAATKVLSAHWATGQQPLEDEHLGALLTWVDPPAGIDIHAAVSMAEGIPMGFKTDPRFDTKILLPLVTAYNKERKQAARPGILRDLALDIRHALRPVGIAIHYATSRAIDLLQSSGLRPLPDLGELMRLEAAAFEDFMRSRDEGYPIPLRDRPKAATFKFAEREILQENVEAALLCHDPISQARAVAEGRVVVGRVANPISGRPCRFDVVTAQRVLHVRPGDEWYWAGDTRLKVAVEDISRERGEVHISLVITAGSRSVGLLPEGLKAVLVPSIPDWNQLWRTRGHLSGRLGRMPWTHEATVLPASDSHVGIPVDPLEAISHIA